MTAVYVAIRGRNSDQATQGGVGELSNGLVSQSKAPSGRPQWAGLMVFLGAAIGSGEEKRDKRRGRVLGRLARVYVGGVRYPQLLGLSF